MVFYLIGSSLLENNEQKTYSEIETNVYVKSMMSQDASGNKFDSEKGSFKLGNLDSLMFVNDQIVKQETSLEGILKKLERQYLDIDGSLETSFKIVTRDGTINIENYISSFKWDDSRFPRNNNVTEIVKIIQNRINTIDSDVRVKTSLLQEAKTVQSQISKKEGNLYSKDLVDVLKAPLVRSGDFVYTDFLHTYVVIVPKVQCEEFLENYHKISENVVPGSAKQFEVNDKDGLTIWRVVLLKIPVRIQYRNFEDDDDKDAAPKVEFNAFDEFNKNARDKFKITVREFVYKEDESEVRDAQRMEIDSKTLGLTSNLKTTLEQAYSDLYISYMHLKHLRFNIDLVMRFGSTNQQLCCQIKPSLGKEKKVIQSLLKIFTDQSQQGMYGTKEELEDVEDFFPFIFVPINIC